MPQGKSVASRLLNSKGSFGEILPMKIKQEIVLVLGFVLSLISKYCRDGRSLPAHLSHAEVSFPGRDGLPQSKKELPPPSLPPHLPALARGATAALMRSGGL